MLNLFAFKDKNSKILFEINIQIFNLFVFVIPYNALLYLLHQLIYCGIWR